MCEVILSIQRTVCVVINSEYNKNMRHIRYPVHDVVAQLRLTSVA